MILGDPHFSKPPFCVFERKHGCCSKFTSSSSMGCHTHQGASFKCLTKVFMENGKCGPCLVLECEHRQNCSFKSQLDESWCVAAKYGSWTSWTTNKMLKRSEKQEWQRKTIPVGGSHTSMSEAGGSSKQITAKVMGKLSPLDFWVIFFGLNL